MPLKANKLVLPIVTSKSLRLSNIDWDVTINKNFKLIKNKED